MKSRYKTHAERELKLLGYKINQRTEDPNKWIVKGLFELLDVFAKQGHSGSSAPYVASMFKELALFKPLSPLTFKADEWNECGEKVFQNNRLSAVFKDGQNGRPYYLDAIVWRDQNGSTFTGTVEGIKSRQFVKRTFIPKTFFIDVIDRGGVNIIKDRSQLVPVFEHYRKRKI